ncbi:hypothetical protein SLS60_010982 [Paraconiothyrium brasiliense]|uniref:Uncharacterized protein n=1 Tax=Paraconiothyrium brasiliense TaxID=300254 RepID=A0ABR3QMJ2_9PLEO
MAIDSVLLGILRAARIAQKGAKDWDYAPSDAMKAYLEYVYKHFPRVMTKNASGSIVSNSYKRNADQNMDTHYGRVWKGAWWQKDDDRKRWRLVELNKHLIEGRSKPESQVKLGDGYKKYEDAARDYKKTSKSRKYTFRDNSPLAPSRLPYDISLVKKPAGPIPQGPRKQTETSRTWKAPRILAPRGPARCSWTSVKINQPKHTPVKPRPPTSQPPPFIKEGTEEGELIELDKSPLDKSYRDIMSCLEMQLTVDITEEDWEDLFKGDV